MRTALVLALLAGCGSTPKPAPDSPQPATASLVGCDQVAKHVAQTASQVAKLRSGATYEAIQNLVSSHCQQDAWSDEAKQCLFEMKTIQDGKSCASKMTDAQQKAIHADAVAIAKDNQGPVDTDDHSDDWIRHVVEEPAPKTTTTTTAPKS